MKQFSKFFINKKLKISPDFLQDSECEEIIGLRDEETADKRYMRFQICHDEAYAIVNSDYWMNFKKNIKAGLVSAQIERIQGVLRKSIIIFDDNSRVELLEGSNILEVVASCKDMTGIFKAHELNSSYQMEWSGWSIE